MISLFLSIMIVSQAIPDTTQPVLTWEPEKPTWGDTITLTYHHDAPDATFKGAAELTATFETESKQMVREGNLSEVSFIVPDSIHRVKLAIHTIESFDHSAYRIMYLSVPEGWNPLKGQLKELWFSWGALDMGYITKEELETQLDSLKANPLDIPEYRFTAMFGHLMLGEVDSAWEILEEMSKKDAGTSEYSKALVNFYYKVQSLNDKLSNERLMILNPWIEKELLTSDSFSVSLLSKGASLWKTDSSTLSVKKQEKILNDYLKRKPYDTYAPSLLADFYLRKGDTASAEKILSEAININLSGIAQKEMGSYHSDGSDIQLSNMFLTRGKIYSARNELDAALADFSFVILMKDNGEGQAYFERAKVWQKLERYKRAEGSFVKSLKAGYSPAEPALKNIFLLNYGKEGYEEYLTKKLMPAEEDDLRIAKDFGFTDLDSIPGRFTDYRGKIVVVNYWGLGCGPCKAEIPWLNELAGKYERTGVEFLAFAFDKADAQKKYIEEHPFIYHNLIPVDRGIFSSIGLGSSPFPWHAVIDLEGRIRYTRIGGSEDNSDIRLIIDQLLREQEMESSN